MIHRRDAGATMLEYSLMAALVALVVFAAVGPVGQAVSSLFESASAGLP